MAKVRTSMALDPAVVEDLQYVTRRLGISKSALVNELLKEALPSMAQVFQLLPEAPTAEDVVRFRGESAKLVEQRLAALKVHTDDLFRE